jgi:hypothetical protein
MRDLLVWSYYDGGLKQTWVEETEKFKDPSGSQIDGYDASCGVWKLPLPCPDILKFYIVKFSQLLQEYEYTSSYLLPIHCLSPK